MTFPAVWLQFSAVCCDFYSKSHVFVQFVSSGLYFCLFCGDKHDGVVESRRHSLDDSVDSLDVLFSDVVVQLNATNAGHSWMVDDDTNLLGGSRCSKILLTEVSSTRRCWWSSRSWRRRRTGVWQILGSSRRGTALLWSLAEIVTFSACFWWRSSECATRRAGVGVEILGTLIFARKLFIIGNLDNFTRRIDLNMLTRRHHLALSLLWRNCAGWWLEDGSRWVADGERSVFAAFRLRLLDGFLQSRRLWTKPSHFLEVAHQLESPIDGHFFKEPPQNADIPGDVPRGNAIDRRVVNFLWHAEFGAEKEKRKEKTLRKFINQSLLPRNFSNFQMDWESFRRFRVTRS